MTKKSKNKLRELVTSLQEGPTRDQRAQDIIKLIRDKKRESEIKFNIIVRDCMMHLSQSDMNRIIADSFDAARYPGPDDVN